LLAIKPTCGIKAYLTDLYSNSRGDIIKIDNIHLCYSLNVFPSIKDVEERLSVIKSKFIKIRQELGLDNSTPFALGLWSDALFVEQMKDQKNLKLVEQFLSDNNFYTYTVNAFPYGVFHNTVVKDKVYQPDWTTSIRKDFTCNAADFLAKLLPDEIVGSISTLPGGYKKHFLKSKISEVNRTIANNLLAVATHLEEIDKRYGKEIILSIEMEPDCLWESPEEFIQFYNEYLKEDNAAQKYIGVCYDTCHQELLSGQTASGIKKLISEGIRIGKIQLSAALKTKKATLSDFLELKQFEDPIYLHQTRLKNYDNKIVNTFDDIPSSKRSEIEQYKKIMTNEEIDNSFFVTHFHIPIFVDKILKRSSAAKLELLDILKIIKNDSKISQNLEIETYTYNVLPKCFSDKSIEDNIIDEYKWILNLWHSM
jgi:hypothetical protein